MLEREPEHFTAGQIVRSKPGWVDLHFPCFLEGRLWGRIALRALPALMGVLFSVNQDSSFLRLPLIFIGFQTARAGGDIMREQ